MFVTLRSIIVSLLSLGVAICIGCGAQQVKREIAKTPVQVNLVKKWSNCRHFEKSVRAEVVTEVNLSSVLLVGGHKETVSLPAGQLGVLVYLGMKPSLGYSVALSKQQSYVQGSELFLNVDQIAPGPGQMVAQMLSYPCGLLTIPDQGYNKITVSGPLRGLPASIKLR